METTASTILLVDNSEQLSKQLSIYLEALGYEIHKVTHVPADLNTTDDPAFDYCIITSDLRKQGKNARLSEWLTTTYNAHKMDEPQNYQFNFNGHVFDAHHQLFDDKHLTSRESEVLWMLCNKQNQLTDKDELLLTIWGKNDYFTARSLAVYMNRLRKYLQGTGYEILCMHRKGYKLVSR